MELSREEAERTAAIALRTHGISADDAALTAEVLVAADALGKHSHGLLRLPRVIRGIEHDNVDPEGAIRVVDGSESDATATIDGGQRLGPVVAAEAVAEAIDRADRHGVGAVGVHDSNHLGMLGYYTEQARREGYVAVGMTNTEPAMPPHGGAEAILGTNPIAIGLPTDPPFNLDMSTSSIARGSVLAASEAGDTIPEGVAIGPDGEPTTDPERALDGVITPFGGPKGSGLAIAVEVLAGGLVGAAMGTDVTGTYHTEDPCTKGDLFVALDPSSMTEGFTERANAFLSSLKQGRTAAGTDEIRLPGETSARRYDRETVTVDDSVLEEVRTLAEEGVAD